MSAIFELSDRAVDLCAAVDPIVATQIGVTGYDDRWTDLSPAGFASRRELFAKLRAEAEATNVEGPDDELALAVIRAALSEWIDTIDNGEYRCDLNNIASPHQALRQTFELMATENATDWGRIAVRLESIDEPLAAYRASLEEGLTLGPLVSRRQIEAVIDQGRTVRGSSSQFNGLLRSYREGDIDDVDLDARLVAAVEHAKAAFAAFNDFLTDVYLPLARTEDGVGRDRYARAVRNYLGSDIDPEETYRWGWSEVERLWIRLAEVAASVSADRTVAEVIELLHSDPERAATSVDEFIDLMSERQNHALASLSGTHFDVPPEIERIEVRADRSGGSTAAHYTPPSEDFSRPGRVWYPIFDRDFFPLFEEVTTAYHEGFPGHHLQAGIQVGLADRLSRFHRIIVWYPGSGEGWALYAEHLMGELGYLEKPDYEVGLLASKLLRAARIAIDIGMHLDLSIPTDVTFHPGESWTFELAVELLMTRGLQSEAAATSEVTRYLGWPGQAISYKIGEQTILDLREEASAHPDFDLKQWHTDLLSIGSVGLDLVRSHMSARWGTATSEEAPVR